MIESTIVWLVVAGSFIAGALTSEWIFDHRNLLRSRLRSLASKFRLSIAIFFAVASCLAAIRAWASLILTSRCASVSDRSSSKSRKNFSCLAKSRHCNTPPNMKANDAPRNISQTRIQSNDDVTSAIMSSNSSTNVIEMVPRPSWRRSVSRCRSEPPKPQSDKAAGRGHHLRLVGRYLPVRPLFVRRASPSKRSCSNLALAAAFMVPP